MTCKRHDWKYHLFTCSPNVAIRKSEGRGLGLFAKRGFEVGDKITSEDPIFTYSSNKPSDEVCEAVNELDATSRRVITSLTCAHDEPHKLWGKLRTNAIPLGAGSTTAGIFPLACRANHQCFPNAEFVWRKDLQKELLFAIRPIQEGEEITVAYLGPQYISRAKRIDSLKRSFNFVCDCERCVDTTESNDDQLQYIGWLVTMLPLVTQFDSTRALEMAELTLCKLCEENVQSPVECYKLHVQAFNAACALDATERMRYHLRCAWKCAKQARGADSELAGQIAGELASYGFI